MSILNQIKSSFPQGRPENRTSGDTIPLPTELHYDEKRNKLIIEVNLAPLQTEAHLYVGETKSGKGFNVLAGLSRTGDFACEVPFENERIGLKVSRPMGQPSRMSFTICDLPTVERIMRANVSQAVVDSPKAQERLIPAPAVAAAKA